MLRSGYACPALAGREVLSVAQMYCVDAAAIAAGTPGIALMEHASAAVARAIRRRWTPRPALALCGPGNNGGDGIGAALALAAAGWPAEVALLGPRAALRADAALMARRWEACGGRIGPLDPAAVPRAALIVDALFGAGLARPVEGAAAAALRAAAASGAPIVAVDVPSGVAGDTGEISGMAAPAAVTTTFCRPKPAHLLMPGRALCGALEVADIGIVAGIVARIGHAARVNGPALWRARLPRAAPGGHKYRRGHAVVVGGPALTGAARLAVRAALRAGAGLATVVAPEAALTAHRAAAGAAMARSLADWPDMLADARTSAVLVGPGNGANAETREHALEALAAGKPTVLDADALTAFASDPAALFAAARGRGCILTPHDGEYARLFDARGDRLSRAHAAADRAGAVVLLKGPESVIAEPGGRAVIGIDGPPELATAGSGDVLAGAACGLLAAGAEPFDAACMAAWLQAATAQGAGPGLIAEDLPDRLPAALARAAGPRPRAAP